MDVLKPESLNRIIASNDRKFDFSQKDESSEYIGSSAESSQSQTYNYIIYIWDGFEASNQTKANALVRANELH